MFNASCGTSFSVSYCGYVYGMSCVLCVCVYRLVSDGTWCQYSNSSHPSHIVSGIAAFYHRITVPLQV